MFLPIPFFLSLFPFLPFLLYPNALAEQVTQLPPPPLSNLRISQFSQLFSWVLSTHRHGDRIFTGITPSPARKIEDFNEI